MPRTQTYKLRIVEASICSRLCFVHLSVLYCLVSLEALRLEQSRFRPAIEMNREQFGGAGPDGAVVRALTSHQYAPGSIPALTSYVG